jgi:uridine monophosphate synthetase
MDQSRNVALDLFDIGAVKFGAFKLKLHEREPNAPLSPIYIDLRLIRSFPSTLRDVSCILGRSAVRFNPDFIADVPTAATPIVGIISAFFDLPMLSPRLIGKQHGVPARVEGVSRAGGRVILIDDLITRADAKLDAIMVLRENGLVVEDVVVLVDREQGGREELERNGCRLHAAMTLRGLLELYVETGRIPNEKRVDVIRYLESA